VSLAIVLPERSTLTFHYLILAAQCPLSTQNGHQSITDADRTVRRFAYRPAHRSTPISVFFPVLQRRICDWSLRMNPNALCQTPSGSARAVGARRRKVTKLVKFASPRFSPPPHPQPLSNVSTSRVGKVRHATWHRLTRAYARAR